MKQTSYMYMALSVYQYLQGRWFFVKLGSDIFSGSLFEVSLVWTWLTTCMLVRRLLAFCKILAPEAPRCHRQLMLVTGKTYFLI